MLCKNYGIIHFTIGSYTLVGAHLPFPTPPNQGQVEERLAGGPFLRSNITSVGLLGVQKIIQITIENATFPNDFGQSFVVTYPFSCFHCRCYAKNTESFILQ